MNYNGPKVGMPSRRQEGAAPRSGDGAVRSRLFAGRTVDPPLLVWLSEPLHRVMAMPDSDNVRGAENQQERLISPGWVVGFVDGEGCFSCPIYRCSKMTLGWQVRPEFAVAQGASSRTVLEALVLFFGCGKVYRNARYDNHREDMYRYCVQRIGDLRDRIVPFFQEYPILTSKRENFDKFAAIVHLMGEGRHLTVNGIIEIAEIAQTMTSGSHPKC